MWFLLYLFMWIVSTLIQVLLFVVGLLVFMVWWMQGRLLYMNNIEGRYGRERSPARNPPGLRSPSELNMPFETLRITTVDGVSLRCWMIMQTTAAATARVPTLVYFHGNAHNIGVRLPNCKDMWTRLGCNVVLVDYRGFGDSNGQPSENGLLADAQAVLDHMHSRTDIDTRQIFVFGRSLGGAVAIKLAARPCNAERIRGLIIENTFTSIPDMFFALLNRMTSVSPRVGHTIRVVLTFFLHSFWPSENLVDSIECPTLFFSGNRDELIPPRQMHTLISNAQHTIWKAVHVVPRGTHNDTYAAGGPTYYGVYRSYMQAVVSDTFVPNSTLMSVGGSTGHDMESMELLEGACIVRANNANEAPRAMLMTASSGSRTVTEETSLLQQESKGGSGGSSGSGSSGGSGSGGGGVNVNDDTDLHEFLGGSGKQGEESSRRDPSDLFGKRNVRSGGRYDNLSEDASAFLDAFQAGLSGN